MSVMDKETQRMTNGTTNWSGLTFLLLVAVGIGLLLCAHAERASADAEEANGVVKSLDTKVIR